MGVDSKLYINDKYNMRDVRTVLEGLGVKVVEAIHREDYSYFYVEIKDIDENTVRATVHAVPCSHYGVSGLQISMKMFEENTELLRKIARVTGGMLQANDCYNTFEGFEDPHRGNAKFVLQHGILQNAITNSKALSEAVSTVVGYK